MIRAVLLDAAGTLLRLAPPAPELQAALVERLDVEVSLERAQEAIGAEIAHYRAGMHHAGTQEAVAALRWECAEVLRDALAEPRLAAVPTGTMTEILLASLRFDAYPEVPAVLARIGDAGLRRIVVSNWDVTLPETLVRAGISGGIDDVITSAGVGAAKPDPAVFRAALRAGAVAPAEAVHVGDRRVEDVEGAHAAGVRAILLARRDGLAPAGAEAMVPLAEAPMRDLSELPGRIGI